MTRGEATRMLVRIKDQINFEWTDSQRKMDALNMAIEALERKGKWTLTEHLWQCDQCGYRQNEKIGTNFCPNCGADMRERREDESIH